jgi:UPF0716 protein FxsA
MLAPGFVTDLFGALLILPVTRPVARRLLTRVVSRRLIGYSAVAYGAGGRTAKRPGSGDTVIRGEVVDDAPGVPREDPRDDQPGSAS